MRAAQKTIFIGLIAWLAPVAAAQSPNDSTFVDTRQAPGLEALAREEALRKAAEAERNQLAEEAQRLRKTVEEMRQKAEEDRKRLADEADALREAAEEAQRKAEEERRKREQALDEANRIAAERAEKARLEALAEAERNAAERAERLAAEKAAEAARQQAEAAERRAAETEAEAKRKADELEARRKAEEEARQRADAKRKADEEARRRAEAEARQRAEAEAKRLAEEAERRRAAEAEAKAAESRAAAEASRAANLSNEPSGGGSCQQNADFEVKSATDQAGRLTIDVSSGCRAGQEFSVDYGRYSFVGSLDQDGEGRFVLDLFEGAGLPVALSLADGSRQEIAVGDINMSGVSKLALIWKQPINLDLHAIEYRASMGGEGHVWPGAPSSFEDAFRKVAGGDLGRGFISTAMSGAKRGDHVDVYTFVHAPGQQRGVVSTFVDYESRGDTPSGEMCGNGPLAAISFEVVELARGRDVFREQRVLPALSCNAPLDASVRYNPDTINDFVIRR